MTNQTKVNLSIDTLLDMYINYITLFEIFGEVKYKTRADKVMNKLKGGNQDEFTLDV